MNCAGSKCLPSQVRKQKLFKTLLSVIIIGRQSFFVFFLSFFLTVLLVSSVKVLHVMSLCFSLSYWSSLPTRNNIILLICTHDAASKFQLLHNWRSGRQNRKFQNVYTLTQSSAVVRRYLTLLFCFDTIVTPMIQNPTWLLLCPFRLCSKH